MIYVSETSELLRGVNQCILELEPAPSGAVELVCECSDVHCTRTLRMTPGEFRSVRSRSRQYAVVPGHERPGADMIVARHVRYVVVRPRRASTPLDAFRLPRPGLARQPASQAL